MNWIPIHPVDPIKKSGMVQKTLLLGNGCHRHFRQQHAGIAMAILIPIPKCGGITASSMRE